jgi:hypothetical protein
MSSPETYNNVWQTVHNCTVLIEIWNNGKRLKFLDKDSTIQFKNFTRWRLSELLLQIIIKMILGSRLMH